MLLFLSSLLFHLQSSKPGRSVITKVTDLRTGTTQVQDSGLIKELRIQTNTLTCLKSKSTVIYSWFCCFFFIMGLQESHIRDEAPHCEDLFKHLMKISHLQLRIYNCNYKMKNKTVSSVDFCNHKILNDTNMCLNLSVCFPMIT